MHSVSYRFGSKKRSAEYKFRNSMHFGTKNFTPFRNRTSCFFRNGNRLVITKRYRFGNLVGFFFSFRSKWQFIGLKLSRNQNLHVLEIRNTVLKLFASMMKTFNITITLIISKSNWPITMYTTTCQWCPKLSQDFWMITILRDTI